MLEPTCPSCGLVDKGCDCTRNEIFEHAACDLRALYGRAEKAERERDEAVEEAQNLAGAYIDEEQSVFDDICSQRDEAQTLYRTERELRKKAEDRLHALDTTEQSEAVQGEAAWRERALVGEKALKRSRSAQAVLAEALEHAADKLGFRDCHHFDPFDICQNTACRAELCRHMQRLLGPDLQLEAKCVGEKC